MSVIQFPGGRKVPPQATTDALLDALTAFQIELARAQLDQIRNETRRANALWTWYCFKRVLFWGFVLWLLATLAAPAKAEPRRFETFYGPNGNYVGSSVRPGGGKFTNYYDRNGQFVGSSVRRGVPRR